MVSDEALAVVLHLQDRPQTDMTPELRLILQRAKATVFNLANRAISEQLNAMSAVANG